ncbi:hypothetical protein C8R45DRAFT_934987 [Mycena sanguinolenta]|nr:hypothetical protein C8R45DRAFT_934987 [Mycena sanguinolenta]
MTPPSTGVGAQVGSYRACDLMIFLRLMMMETTVVRTKSEHGGLDSEKGVPASSAIYTSGAWPSKISTLAKKRETGTPSHDETTVTAWGGHTEATTCPRRTSTWIQASGKTQARDAPLFTGMQREKRRVHFQSSIMAPVNHGLHWPPLRSSSMLALAQPDTSNCYERQLLRTRSGLTASPSQGTGMKPTLTLSPHLARNP